MPGKLKVRLVIVSEGLRIEAHGHFPAGRMLAGGYDPTSRTVYLGKSGHPQGMSAAGGNPSDPRVAGITMFIRIDGRLFWSNDSQSLFAKLSIQELDSIQLALAEKYDCPVRYLDRIDEIVRYP